MIPPDVLAQIDFLDLAAFGADQADAALPCVSGESACAAAVVEALLVFVRHPADVHAQDLQGIALHFLEHLGPGADGGPVFHLAGEVICHAAGIVLGLGTPESSSARSAAMCWHFARLIGDLQAIEHQGLFPSDSPSDVELVWALAEIAGYDLEDHIAVLLADIYDAGFPEPLRHAIAAARSIDDVPPDTVETELAGYGVSRGLWIGAQVVGVTADELIRASTLGEGSARAYAQLRARGATHDEAHPAPERWRTLRSWANRSRSRVVRLRRAGKEPLAIYKVVAETDGGAPTSWVHTTGDVVTAWAQHTYDAVRQSQEAA